MNKTQSYIGTPNGIVLCIDCKNADSFSGRFYHGYQMDPITFTNTVELLHQMEALFDEIEFPYKTMNFRNFGGIDREKNRAISDIIHAKDMKTFSKDALNNEMQLSYKNLRKEKTVSDKEMLDNHGDLGTFIIRVQHRQNSSWQGRVTWVDQDKTVCFRSIWELVKLIDNAILSNENIEIQVEDTPEW